MYKVSFYIKFCTIIIIVLMAVVLSIISIAIADIYFFILLFLVLFFIIRAIKYLYLIHKSDFNAIKKIDDGLLLQIQSNDIFIPYIDIKSISIQEIGIFRGILIYKISIETKDSYLNGYISQGTEFQNSIPDSISIYQQNGKYFKW